MLHVDDAAGCCLGPHLCKCSPTTCTVRRRAPRQTDAPVRSRRADRAAGIRSSALNQCGITRVRRLSPSCTTGGRTAGAIARVLSTFFAARRRLTRLGRIPQSGEPRCKSLAACRLPRNTTLHVTETVNHPRCAVISSELFATTNCRAFPGKTSTFRRFFVEAASSV